MIIALFVCILKSRELHAIFKVPAIYTKNVTTGDKTLGSHQNLNIFYTSPV
jgi:hypothetical protein